MELDLRILFGTVRDGRRSIWVARYVESLLQNRPGGTTHLWDPANLPFASLVRREWEMTGRPASVDPFVRAMDRADWDALFGRFFTGLGWYARALKVARTGFPPPPRSIQAYS